MDIIKKKLIKTERLELKPCTEADLDELVGLLTNAEITKTFMVPSYESIEQYKDLARKLIEFSRVDNLTHLESGIFLDGKLIGFINDCGFDDEELEIGYVISPEYKGQGYATEAVGAMLAELKVMGFRRVTAGFFEGNEGSKRVMEKCGMHLTDDIEYEEYRSETHKCYYCEIVFHDNNNNRLQR